MFDIIIIGGGIAGLYAGLKLSKKHKVIVLDDRKYYGGRIHTNKKPQYEIGAARFNSNHKILNKLVKQFKLTKFKLPKNFDYLDKKGNLIKNINKKIDERLKYVISKKDKNLRSKTFKEFCNEHLTFKETKELINWFGYTSEFLYLNAYDAVRTFKNDFTNKNYFVLGEGLTELCNRMAKEINIKLNSKVLDVNKEKDHFVVKTKTKKYLGKKIIFAVKAVQLKQFKILNSIKSMFSSVRPEKLLRIYAIYKNGWFNDLKRTTTNSKLRHIIPINYEKGLIMISYTDGKDVNYFLKNGKLDSDSVIKKKIKKELDILFPNKNIPNPIYFKCHYWSVGAHYWKKNYDSNKIMKKMINPINNIYICGEGFSQNQAWIEGSLLTTQKVIKKISECS